MKRLLYMLGLLLSCPAYSYYSHPYVAEDVHEYACGGLKVNVVYEPGKAHVVINHYSYILTLARSASGSYYHGDILSFWDRGKTALLVYSADRKLDCQRQESLTHS